MNKKIIEIPIKLGEHKYQVPKESIVKGIKDNCLVFETKENYPMEERIFFTVKKDKVFDTTNCKIEYVGFIEERFAQSHSADPFVLAVYVFEKICKC